MKNKFKNIYEPEEDSKFLLDVLLGEFSNKKNLDICEVGVGSGFVISNFAKKNAENIFYGSDINKFAIEFTKNEFERLNLKVDLREGNLLEPFKRKKFDLIFFNTPYLPCETGDKFEDLSLKDRAIYGGKRGYEVIFEFVCQLKNYLKKDGVCFMLFSSLSNFDEIKIKLESELLDFEEVARKRVFFEDLIVLKIEKFSFLDELKKKGVNDIKYLAKGKHSIVLNGKFDGENVIVKTGIAQYIEKEVFFLDKLKKESFVPKMFFYSKNYVVREKFSGQIILDFLESSSKSSTIKVFNEVLKICFRLDELEINKDEMTNPYKHIYVFDDLSVKMIDYERSIFSENPKNLRQFLQYVRRNIRVLKAKGINISEEKLFDIGKKYHKTKFNFKFEDLFEA